VENLNQGFSGAHFSVTAVCMIKICDRK